MKHVIVLSCSLAALSWGSPVHAATDDGDALSLPSAPDPVQVIADRSLRLYVEGALGHISQRYDLPALNSRRFAFDLSLSTRVADRWQLVFSDRLDTIHSNDSSEPSTRNSVREAYASWQSLNGQTIFEFGRVNLRYGPAYGYNPTDFFKAGTLRTVTTADPLSLRRDRLGTVMLRLQHLWADGGVSIAVAPKLADEPSNNSFSLDLGSTNAHDQGLLTYSAKFSEVASGQLLAHTRSGESPKLGASLTVLMSESAVAYFEASRGRDQALFGNMVAGRSTEATRNRLAAGATYTTSGQWALTAEYEYNGFAPDRAAWNAGASSGLSRYGQFLLAAQRQQDTASRQSWLLYASRSNLFWKSLDLTALLRLNAEDKSYMSWLEFRYHWPKVDGALRLQATRGKAFSEYGLLPHRNAVQVLGVWYY